MDLFYVNCYEHAGKAYNSNIIITRWKTNRYRI